MAHILDKYLSRDFCTAFIGSSRIPTSLMIPTLTAFSILNSPLEAIFNPRLFFSVSSVDLLFWPNNFILKS